MRQTVLHPALGDQFSVLAGLSMGISSGTVTDIACYRVVWEHLGETVSLKKTLLDCGIFDIDSAEIPEDILSRIRNDIGQDDEAFVSRPRDKRG